MIKRFFVSVTSVAILFGVLSIQASFAADPVQPEDVARQFWKLETAGARLTGEGWLRSATLADDAMPHPSDLGAVFRVISNNSKIEENKLERSRKRVVYYASFREYGQIGFDLRFCPTPTSTAEGVWIKQSSARYVLTLTDTHWRFDGNKPEEIHGREEWRIRGIPHPIYVSVDAAIRYVTERSKSTKSDQARRNAARTLRILQRLH